MTNDRTSSRRGFMAGALGAGALAALPRGARAAEPPKLVEVTSIPDALKGSGEVRVVGYGGAGQEAQRKAYFEPFERLSGIKVRDMPGADAARLRAMVDTKNVEWDVAQLSYASVLNLMKIGDYWEKIDYSLVDTGNIDPIFRHEYALDMLPYATVAAYRTDTFGGKAPQSWADFWDVKAFPGPRSMIGGGTNSIELEFALMADGVPIDKVYPIDIDRAFASLTKIKPAIVKWWETGAVPAQLLTDKEVVMTTAWNGRISAIQDAGAPVAIMWNQGRLARDAWTVPKGAANRVNAMKFIAFTTMAIPQARLSSLIPYGFVNRKSPEYMTEERLSVLPTAPQIQKKLIAYDYEWWAANRDAVTQKFNRFVLE